MWIVVGSKHKYIPKPNGLEVTKTCPKCNGPRKLFEVVPKEYFTIFWVPLFPTDEKQPVLECPGCQTRFRIDQGDYSLAAKQRESNVPKESSRTTQAERVVVNCPICQCAARVPKADELIRVKCPKCEGKHDVRNGAIQL